MLAYIFLIFAVAVRFIPHPFTFTPVAAALLFFGSRGPRRQLWIPFVALAASDVILTKLVYAYPFSWDHYITWAWYAAILWLGTTLGQNTKPLRVAAAALVSSVSFFVLSNFAVWAVWGDLYPKTMAGLITCYVAAIPFFRNAVAGDLLFTAAFFAVPVMLQATGLVLIPNRRR